MSKQRLPGVTVVILNWNGADFLRRFLPSVQASDYPALEILVVDNASTDESYRILGEEFPEVRRVQLDRNYGFAEGNNRALPYIHTTYFVLLNSDVAVTPSWLEPLVRMAESDPHIGAIQPKLRAEAQPEYFEYAGAAGGLIDRLGYPFCRGRIFDTLERDEGQYEEARQVFWASGACMFLRTDMVRRIGLFDGVFFAHMEEIDLCWRAQNAGYRIMACPESEVYHVGGGTLPQGNPRKTFLNFRNSLLCLQKNLPAAEARRKILARLLLLDPAAALQALLAGRLADVKAIARAHWAFFGLLKHARYQKAALGIPTRPLRHHRGVYRGVLVIAYFFRGKRTFSALAQDETCS